MVVGLPNVKPPKGQCIPCIKEHREAFSKKASRRATSLLELVHIGLCGLISEASLGGSKYFMLIVDDFSRSIWVYFLSSNSNSLVTFIYWKNLFKKESCHTMKAICSNHGFKFPLHTFVGFYTEFGI